MVKLVILNTEKIQGMKKRRNYDALQVSKVGANNLVVPTTASETVGKKRGAKLEGKMMKSK